MRGRISALHKPHPGAPICYSSGIPRGFYFGARHVEGSDAVNKPPVNMAANPLMKSKSSPEVKPELQQRPRWYWPETQKEWYKTGETLDKERASRLSSILEEESSTISSREEARIKPEIHVVMNQKFVADRAELENNPVLQNLVESGAETSDNEVIDLLTPFAASLQKS